MGRRLRPGPVLNQSETNLALNTELSCHSTPPRRRDGAVSPRTESGKSVSVECLIVPVEDSDTTGNRGKQQFHPDQESVQVRRRPSRHQSRLGREQLQSSIEIGQMFWRSLRSTKT